MNHPTGSAETAHQRAALAALRRVITPGTRVAHVGYPDHWNAGDPAIWLGTQNLLARLGCRVVYQCSWRDYDPRVMAACLGDGPVLIAGGGNLGDLWPNHQRFRERILEDFPRNRVVQMPQSWCFEDPSNLERFKALANRHNDFHVFMRDAPGAEVASAALTASITLCPDFSCGLGLLPRPSAALYAGIALLRSDKEGHLSGAGQLPVGVKRVDWIDFTAEDAPHRSAVELLRQFLAAGHDRARQSGADAVATMAEIDALATEMAWIRVRRGLRLLSQGDWVVTDRLHGYLLAEALGIPHFILDNRNGKVRAYFNTWSSRSGVGTWLSSFGDLARYLPEQGAKKHA